MYARESFTRVMSYSIHIIKLWLEMWASAVSPQAFQNLLTLTSEPSSVSYS